MFVIPKSKMVTEKVNKILNGFSAYAESPLVAESIRKEIKKAEVEVIEDVTDKGVWFTPKNKK